MADPSSTTVPTGTCNAPAYTGTATSINASEMTFGTSWDNVVLQFIVEGIPK